MNTILWIGFGFVVLLIVFLVVAFFIKVERPHQWEILRFLSALCAGFAGGLLTGTALFSISKESVAGKLSVSGTAGMALFFVVFFFFRRLVQRPPDAFNFSIPSGWAFEDCAKALVHNSHYVVSIEGFDPNELRAPMEQRTLEVQSRIAALKALGHLAKPPGFPPYKVEVDDNIVHVKKI